MTDSKPIFIGGLMRSGTTLLRAMLGQHSQVAAGLETHWFELDWTGRRARRGEPLQDYLDQLADFFELPREAVRDLMDRAANAEEFLSLFMADYARRQGKSRWAEKTPGNCRHACRILAVWPDAKVLHILRHPRDVFASFKRSGKYGGPEDYGALWADFLGDVENFKAAKPEAARASLREIAYEELVATPEPVMRDVAAFAELPWEPTIAKFEGKQDEYQKVRSLTGHSSTTLEELSKPLSTDRVGGGAEVIDDAAFERARKVVADRGLGALFDRVVHRAEAAAQG